MTFVHSTTGIVTAIALSLTSTGFAYATAPELQTSAPIIYLADNLDEEANLGWCIDTVGRGFNEQLQSHSCKPTKEGGSPEDNDVKFVFDAATGHIASVAFENKCMTLSAPDNENIPFELLDCSDDVSQKFTYDSTSGQFKPVVDETMCVAVAPASRKAGPFMSRDLKLSSCEDTDPTLINWKIKAE